MAASVSAVPFGSIDVTQPQPERRMPPPDNSLAWASLSWPAQLYVGSVMIGGASAFVAFFPTTYPPPLLFVALTVFACVTSTWKVTLPIAMASGSTLSVSYAANLMAMLLLGPRHAVLVAIAGVWTQCTYRAKQPYPLYRTFFSLGGEVLTMVATGVVYQQAGGTLLPVDATALARPLVGAIATYFAVNTALVAGAIALTSRRSFFAVWREDFLWSGASFMVAGSAGAMAALVVNRGEAWKAVLLIAPIYLTYRTYELFVGRLEDQRRHMSEMRHLHHGTVEALMQARQAEHAEQAARSAAERANRLKDEFLAIVSHELRTPLNSILGWSDMLRRGRLDDARRERAFQAIYDSARRQAKLIDDLLDVSRVMSGTMRLERSAVDLKDVIEDALQVVQPVAESKDVRILTIIDSWVGFIQGDPVRLQQVVTNLLSNAIKFTATGGVVHLQLRRAGDSAELQVSDTGQGISAEFLPYVFEPFRQGDGSTTRIHGGLGLGLSIVKHLVEAHGGTISAESAGPGQGATFVARFPIDPECAASPAGRLTLRASARGNEAIRGLHVLVVDDDDESRFVVAEHLRTQQAEVLTAKSAAEAYEVLLRDRVDVLLADIAMPGEDGYTLIRRVRAGIAPGATAIPAAALTAFAREDDRHAALRAGFQMHLVKPIDAASLVSAVAALGRMRRASSGV